MTFQVAVSLLSDECNAVLRVAPVHLPESDRLSAAEFRDRLAGRDREKKVLRKDHLPE